MSVFSSAFPRGAVFAALAFLMAGCGSDSSPPQSATSPVPGQAGAVSEAPAAAASASAAAEADRAEAALRADRLFTPAGDNAFELFLLAAEVDPANARVRAALDDLVPYAVLHVEQRSAARDREEAERVLSLIERAQPQAPALPRLRREVLALAATATTAPTVAAPAANASTGAAPAASTAAVDASSRAAPAPSASPSASATRLIEGPAPPAPSPAAAVAAQTPLPSAPAQPEPAPTVTSRPTQTTPDAAPAVGAAGAASQPPIPQLIQRPSPRYPPLAERRRIEGEVELEFTIAADGSVTGIEVIRAEPEGIFEREAIGALQRWRYAPPEAPLRARRTLEFRLSR